MVYNDSCTGGLWCKYSEYFSNFRHGMQHSRVPVFHKEGMAGDTADQVEGDDKKQDIFQSAEPVVADHPEKMVKWFFCDQKSGQRADGKK